MQKRMSSHIDNASSILEKRNKAFRVLYNTVIEVTQAQDDDIFTILTKNLREISQATTAALAVFDRSNMSVTLKSVNHKGQDMNIEPDDPFNVAIVAPEVLDFFQQSVILEPQVNDTTLADLLPDSCLYPLGSSGKVKKYNISCLRDKDIFAFGLISFDDNNRLKMKDMVDTYLGLASVIIQRAQAVRELSISKQWFQKLLSCSPVGIMVINQNREIVEINDSALELVNSTRENIIGKCCKNLVCQEPSMSCPIFDEGKLIDQEERQIMHSDGHTIPVLKNALPVEIDNEPYLIETIVDISERIKAEEELKKSEETFKSIFDGANDAIFIHSISNGRMLNVNHKVEEMLGYTKEEILKMSIRDVSVEGSAFSEEKGKKYFQDALSSPQLFEWEFKHKNGTVFPTEVNLKKVSILGKERVMAVVRDISERRKMEEEILKIRKLESVGVLAGGIAHDFNNLLTVIIGNLSVAQMDIDPTDQSLLSLLENAQKASMRAKDLSTQLLTFSKGGAPVKKTTSIKNIVVDSVNFMLKGSNVKCEFSIPDDLCQVEVDEGQISQVIYNLVLNAQQAMPNGGTLRVSCENNFSPKDFIESSKNTDCYLKLSVADEGIGIPEALIDKIFDPYFTTKDKDAVKGTGLGLSTCYSIIKKHDGIIDVKSQVNKGTVFDIYLPAARGGKTVPALLLQPEIIQGDGKILVMDDEPMVQSIMGDILRRLGYEASFVSNGAEALEQYNMAYHKGEPFDAIIMDLTIPGGMGGKDTMAQLYKEHPDVKAIVSSGYSNDPVMANYQKYGFLGVVSKPVKISELSSMLHDIIHPKDTPSA